MEFNLFYYAFFFIIGALLGSFVNVCVYRIPRQESIVYPPSHCPFCSHQLGFFDLFPIISFLLLGGRCRYCHRAISWRYLFVEAVMGGLFVLAAYLFKDLNFLIFNLIWILLGMIIILIDWDYQMIEDEPIILGAVAALVFQFVRGDYLGAILGGVIGFGFFYLVRYIGFLVYKKEVLGFGDVKLGITLGIIGSFPGVFKLIFMAYLLGAAISLLLILSRLKTLKDYIPFGPFLVVASFLYIWFGEFIWAWYVNLFR